MKEERWAWSRYKNLWKKWQNADLLKEKLAEEKKGGRKVGKEEITVLWITTIWLHHMENTRI